MAVSAKTVVVLGGGWGGLAAAHALRELLPVEHRIRLVERSGTFSLCTSYLWLMTGERRDPDQIRRELGRLSRPGIEWVHDEITRIDPATRSIETTSGRLDADYVVIALGAELAPDVIPGLAASAHNLYDIRDVARLHKVLSGFREGRLVILIARTPFRCPAAPYEAALLAEWMLRKNGVRAQVDVALYTPEPQPMPVAGPAVGNALRAFLAERGIRYQPNRAVVRVDGSSRRLHFPDETVPFDLLMAVPPHRAPGPVVEAGLTDASGYVPVHPQTLEILADHETLETRFPGVYAIGDVTAIRLMDAMLLPKAGVFVEAEARVVAENIAAQIEGREPMARFDGRGFCYVEVGDAMAAYGSGDFFAFPVPTVTLDAPSAAYRRAKEEFERLLETWFIA